LNGATFDSCNGKLLEDGRHTRPKHVGGKHLHRLGCKDILIHSNKCIYKYSALVGNKIQL
jgi:hypothetical protein